MTETPPRPCDQIALTMNRSVDGVQSSGSAETALPETPRADLQWIAQEVRRALGPAIPPKP